MIQMTSFMKHLTSEAQDIVVIDGRSHVARVLDGPPGPRLSQHRSQLATQKGLP